MWSLGIVMHPQVMMMSIAINEKPSLFDTPSCFMAKATKVQSDDECDDEEQDKNESDSDDEPTKDELFDILEDTKKHFDIKRRECKSLNKEVKALCKENGPLAH